MCVKCGTNLRTGQQISPPSGRPGAQPRIAPAPAAPTNWAKSPVTYILGSIALLFAVLFGLGFVNPIFKLLFIVAAILYCIAARLTVVVFAFKDDGAGRGIRCLLLEISTIKYVFGVSRRSFLKAAYGLVLALVVAIIAMAKL